MNCGRHSYLGGERTEEYYPESEVDRIQFAARNMMISKETFVKLITMMMNTIDDKREFIEDNDYIPDECKDCILEECDFLKDLITMLTCIMIDRFGVIRDYLYDRDENGEYFFGIPKGNKIEVYLLTSAEELYDYLSKMGKLN